MSVTVRIEEGTLLEMLLERCNAWSLTKDNIDLFEQMYENYISSGVFTGREFDVMQIVDNDAVNYCEVISKGDKDFDKLLELYNNGERDVSCEEFEDYSISYIEVVSDDEERILVRL